MKNSNKYYDDTSQILGNMILRNLAPKMQIPWAAPFQLDDRKLRLKYLVLSPANLF